VLPGWADFPKLVGLGRNEVNVTPRDVKPDSRLLTSLKMLFRSMVLASRELINASTSELTLANGSVVWAIIEIGERREAKRKRNGGEWYIFR